MTSYPTVEGCGGSSPGRLSGFAPLSVRAETLREGRAQKYFDAGYLQPKSQVQRADVFDP
jgi:hypothetical protein